MARVNPELSEVLTHVAEQLIEADKNAKARGLAVMKFDECEVEFNVKIEGGGDLGIKVWVVEAKASGKYEQSNKVKVKFKALADVTLQASQLAHQSAAAPTPRQATAKRTGP